MLERGRTHQKRRTHAALVTCALGLLRAGQSPTISEVALATGVSPATAYRYFPSARALWTAVLAEIAGPTVEEVFAGCPDDDPEARVEALVRAISFRMFDDEALWRTAARLLQDRDPLARAKPGDERIPVPTGKRLQWIEHALAPLANELPKAAYRQLSMALALVIGAETVLALRDVCRLEVEEAKSVTLWAARALVRNARSESGELSTRPAGQTATQAAARRSARGPVRVKSRKKG
ncbi:MAG TPA: TetR/AcrR family transcriptional regulator [Polyangiales bacterium]|nr:TetR/AcrR family transcriptional regulator [Polyangiales bacterium]